jgi:hypothetical protein
MPEFEHEKHLHGLRAEAWDAFRAMLGRPHTQAFAAAADVYERELRALLSADAESDRDYVDEMQHLTRARKNVQQMIDAIPFGTAEHYGLQMILADLNAVLGPDLLREADPTGEVLKELPFEERRRMLDAIPDGPLDPEHERAAREMLGAAQRMIEERGGEQPPFIVIVLDEAGPLFEKARKQREQ